MRSRIGILKAEAPHLLQADTIGPRIAECFDLAVDTGISIAHCDEVRRSAAAFTPKLVGAIVVRNCMIQFALETQARIIANTDFRSRGDVEAIHTMINDSFSSVAESVADYLDSMTWRAIIALHAALSFYLIETTRPLPRMMTYQFNQPMTTLTTAYRLYDNAGRADEIRYENKIIHPAFARREGRALSA